MREIEFRAYNKAIDKMRNWDFIKRVRNLNQLLKLNHVEVMQYTGLKDKNGKKIFEGDIYKDVDEEEVFYYIAVWIKEICCFGWLSVQEYRDYLFMGIKGIDDCGVPFNIDESELKRIEVIGNIHENTELLK